MTLWRYSPIEVNPKPSHGRYGICEDNGIPTLTFDGKAIADRQNLDGPLTQLNVTISKENTKKQNLPRPTLGTGEPDQLTTYFNQKNSLNKPSHLVSGVLFSVGVCVCVCVCVCVWPVDVFTQGTGFVKTTRYQLWQSTARRSLTAKTRMAP